MRVFVSSEHSLWQCLDALALVAITVEPSTCQWWRGLHSSTLARGLYAPGAGGPLEGDILTLQGEQAVLEGGDFL